MKTFWALGMSCLILLSACASAPAASADKDKEAKQFVTADGTANLYVARKSEMFGSIIAFKLLVDDKEKGSLSPATYQLFVLPPGQHKIEVSTGLKSARLTVDVAAGKNYFLSTGATAGDAIIQPELGVVLFEEMGKLMVSQFPRAPIQE